MNKPYFTVKEDLMIGIMLMSLSLLGVSGQAMAEAADRDKPIDLEADTVKVDDSKQISTYSGRVILTQGTLVIHADKLIVREDNLGFQHSTSLGNPTTFKQKMEGKNEYMEGSAQRIEYNGRMDKVQLYTKAWVKRGEDIVHGDYIMYDANAEYAEVIGGGPQGTSGGRVRAVIQPKGKQPAVPLNPAPAKSSETPAKTSSMTINPADDVETALPEKNMRLSRNLAVSPQQK